MDEIIITDEESSQPKKRARWYLLHTYSGFEQRVEKTIKEMIRRGEDNGLIHDCLVPVERVIELSKSGSKRTTSRKLYPGYVMVNMVMEPHSWNLVQNIPKVTGFIGAKNDPTPIKDDEVEAILSRVQTGKDTPRPKFSFDRGEEVRIIDGPFSGFNGVVDDVNYDKGKLRVSVSIFGRQTPVELDFVQVSKE
ncbi:MAG: transcription termination/antitermination protein NusG [Desulfovibrionaceae bacterium]|nr:transcription termination/antitermination protein NusG [Desulfovibrionaceae bacterium]